jgi:hypothetical protein
MKLARRMMAVLLVSSCVPAASAAPGVEGLYRGRIAGKNVIALLGAPDKDGQFLGQYAYLHVGAALDLLGKTHGDTAAIEERAHLDVTGRWSVTFTDKGLQGKWADPDGKRTHDIALVRQVAGDGHGHAVEPGRKKPRTLEDLYDREIAHRNLVGKDEVVAGDFAYHMVVHTQADVAYPRLTRHPDPKALARINAALDKLQQESVAQALKCLPSLDPNFMYQDTVSVDRFSPDFLSLSISGGATCTGPGDWSWTSAATYDMKTGGEIDLNDEFRLGSGAKGTGPGFGRKALPVVLKHIDRDPDPEESKACLPAGGDYRLVMSLTSSGLKVIAEFASHMEIVCQREAVIPFAELAPFRKPGSTYRFD